MKFLGGTAQTVACGFALCMALASGAWADPGSAKVQAMQGGSAQYSLDGVTFSPLQEGTVLQQGATIKTDSMGVVDLYLGKNGPSVRLTPATTLKLTTLSSDAGAGETILDTELELSAGCIAGIVRKMSLSSRYEVRTPVGTADIRAGKYQICATGRLIVEEGMADFSFAPAGAAAATSFEVPAEYMFDPTLSSGRGGVVPTPFNIRDNLRSEFAQMRGGAGGGEEPVQVWSPTPSWMQPDRPFDEPSLQPDGIGKPWVRPPVLNPTVGFEEYYPPISPWRPRR